MKEINLEDINDLTLGDAAAEYLRAGFKVTPCKPNQKAAYEPGWNTPGYTCHPDHWKYNPGDNIGCVLEPTGLCVVDVDALDEFRICMKALGNLTAETELPFWESDTAGIKSGKPNRAKLVFRVTDTAPADLTYHKLLWNDAGDGRHTVFELRCGFVQDILPPSVHPDTGKPYEWIGGDIKPMPADLLLLWQQWDTFAPILRRADRFYREDSQTPQRGRPRKYTGRDVIGEWNERQSLCGMLERYGYTRIGNRYLSPDSHSNSPGIIILDGGRKFFAHNESDYFADGHLHDAFDLIKHFEYKDDGFAAIRMIKDELGIGKITDKDLIDTLKRMIDESGGGRND